MLAQGNLDGDVNMYVNFLIKLISLA